MWVHYRNVTIAIRSTTNTLKLIIWIKMGSQQCEHLSIILFHHRSRWLCRRYIFYLHVSKNKNNTGLVVLIYFKGYPLLNNINLLLLRIVEGGLISYWTRILSDEKSAITSVNITDFIFIDHCNYNFDNLFFREKSFWLRAITDHWNIHIYREHFWY